MGATSPKRLLHAPATTLAMALIIICISAGLASATDAPLDARGLPMWEAAVWSDFPVELHFDDAVGIDALLAAVPIASFHREQVNVAGSTFILHTRVTETELRQLERAGYTPRRIADQEREQRNWIEARWAEQAARGGEALRIGERGVYHSYSQMANILLDAQTDHPAIAQRGSIGQSVQGRELWTLVISDNVGVEEAEPELRISANMHGNEKISMEMSIYLIEYLTDNYGQSGYEDVTYLVDNYEIHLLPLHNPDGHVVNSRSNANGVDLNRNFPVPDGAVGGDGTWNEEIETVAMKNWGFSQNFVISQDGHSGALVVNYPWDYTYALTPDDAAFIELAEEYSYYNSPMWNGDWYHGITNGAQWYVTEGSLQDWAYHETGSMHVIVEFSDSYAPSAGQLDGYWDDNRESFMHWMKAARYGVNGTVTQAGTGLPLDATVTVVGNSKVVSTDPDHGDYYKLLDNGSYTLRFEADGHVTQEISGVSTSWGTPTVLNVELVSEATGAPDLPAKAVRFVGAYPNPFNPTTTLRFSLPEAGEAALVIHDARGRVLRTLTAGTMLAAGAHEFLWDGRDEGGVTLPSAVYLARLTVGEEVLAKKLLLLK
jgi:hypothetical protein